ncbi:MAG: Ig-like domain-containing protein [Bryobacteraceae bacterium]
MSKKTPVLLAALSILSCAQFAQARNVFILPPGDGTFRPVANFVGDPFAPASVPNISAAADTFAAFSTPSGKFYFVGRSSTDTVVVTDSNYNVIARRNLGLGASAAAMTPDGRYLVVAAGTVQIFSTSSDTVVSQVDAGSNPNDVAISLDSSKAFVTSNASQRLTAIDLNTFNTSGILQSLGPVNGVNVGPNGLVYVAAQNILYEIDPRDLSYRGGSGISLNGQPGKPAFAADGSGTIRVLLPNLNTAFGGASALTVDLISRTATSVFANGVVFDRIVPVSGSRAFAISQGQQLYELNLPSSASIANISGLTTSNGVRSIAVSDEFPNARYLYVASSSNNTVTRVDLNSNTASGSFPLSGAPGNLNYAGPASSGLPTAIYGYNNGQFLQPSAQSLPLVVRVVDSNGKPLQNVPITFSTTALGAFIVSGASSTTGANGVAQAIVLAPSNLGAFTVTATAGFTAGINLVSNFTLTVGTGTTGATGLVAVRGGNGQIIRETAVTPELLRVIVRDSSGNPVPNAVVTWSVTTANGPNGTLLNQVSVTDVFGEATNTYIGPFLGPNLLQSYVQSTITASTYSGTVNMYVTVIPVVFNQNPASLPTVQVVQPVTEAITGQVGTTIPAAVQVRVAAGSGPGSGTPIPNVGISVSTGNDPSFGVSARCSETTGLTDATGFASCDLVLGSRIGLAPLTIYVGGQSVAQINLTTTPGVPGKIVVVQGDGQTGNAGATLPLALVARVEDAYGNALPNAPVTWTVESGSATLINTINRSDTTARVSTLVRLGNAPGQVRIRVTAQGGSSAATTTFTVSLNIAATQIRRVSGDGQSAQVNRAFGEQLVAQVLDANNAPVPNVPVTFSVRSGSAVIGTANAISDGNGNASTSVTAGSVAGSVTVAAEFSGNVVTWNLTVLPLGPTLNASGITNAASGQTQIAPGSIVTIRGSNIVASARGYVLPANELGPRPTTLAGASVTFGGVAAPIFWAANVDGQESITVQVPFEAPENSVIPVTVTSNGVSATVNVSISPAAPGIFENTDSQGRRFAVVTRTDGTFVTPDNPIGRGETARVYVTGLGRVNGATSTNAMGAGQSVAATVIVGVNDGGVTVTSAQYAPGLIGVYAVAFVVPADSATGSNRNLAVAVDSGGTLVFGNSSTIAIR